MRASALSARLAVAGVAGFWGLAFLAAALVPGYSLRADYTSSLAGRGSSVAVLGVTALGVLALGHVAAAVAVADRSRAVAGWVALAALGGFVSAGFGTACPLGAPGCGFGANDAPPDLLDRLHVLGVGIYQGALLAAMAAVVIGTVRARRWPGWLAAAAVVAAPASLLLLAPVGGPDTGTWQRAWLVVTTGWLLLLVLAPPSLAPSPAPSSPLRTARSSNQSGRKGRS